MLLTHSGKSPVGWEQQSDGSTGAPYQPKHQKEQPSLQIAVNYQSLALKCLEPVL